TGQLIINGQNGLDTVNIGASAGNPAGMAGIRGDVSITNVFSRTALNVSDQNFIALNPRADVVVLNHANGVGTVAGVSPGAITYVANDVRAVTLTGGIRNDLFVVRSTPGPFATVTINGNSGNDTISVGGVGNTLDTILGPVIVNGGSGSDTLNVLD